METDGIRRRFELYADLLEDIHLQQVRLYARRQSASAPSSPSWDGMPGGVGVPGDRVGNGAAAVVDQEAELRESVEAAKAMRTELVAMMRSLEAKERNVLMALYFDGPEKNGKKYGMELVMDIMGYSSTKSVRAVRDRAFEKMERMGLRDVGEKAF